MTFSPYILYKDFSLDDATRTLVADGHVEVDGRYIYRMKRFAIRLE